MTLSHRRALALAFAILLPVAALIFPDRLATLSGQTFLSEQASSSLSAALTRNTVVFGTLSSVKALFGVVEGSTVGVSLGASVALQLGDLVQPVLEYIDFIWDLFLYALFLITLYKLLIESGILSLGLVAAAFGAGLWVYDRARRTPGAQPRRGPVSLVVFGLVISFGIPAAVLVAEALSTAYIEPLQAHALTAAGAQLDQLKSTLGELAALRERLSVFSPGASVDEVVRAAQALAQRASSIAWDTFSSLLYYLAALLLELLLLPACLVFAFRSGLKGAFASFLIGWR